MGKTLTCCTHFWRWLFVALNVAFALIGLALIAVGIWLEVIGEDFEFVTESKYASPAVLVIVSGVITVVISVVGVVGAIGMWSCVLIVYISFMAIVVILQIVAGILGFVFQDSLRDAIEDRSFDAISRYTLNGTSADVNRFIDYVQRELDCCGFSGPSDWLDTIFANESLAAFPESPTIFPESCECNITDCDRCAPFGGGTCILNETRIWTQGCNESLTDVLEDNLGIIAGVGVAFGLFEISGVAVALGLCVCACMKRGKDDDIPIDEYVY